MPAQPTRTQALLTIVVKPEIKFEQDPADVIRRQLQQSGQRIESLVKQLAGRVGRAWAQGLKDALKDANKMFQELNNFQNLLSKTTATVSKFGQVLRRDLAGSFKEVGIAARGAAGDIQNFLNSLAGIHKAISNLHQLQQSLGQVAAQAERAQRAQAGEIQQYVYQLTQTAGATIYERIPPLGLSVQEFERLFRRLGLPSTPQVLQAIGQAPVNRLRSIAFTLNSLAKWADQLGLATADIPQAILQDPRQSVQRFARSLASVARSLGAISDPTFLAFAENIEQLLQERTRRIQTQQRLAAATARLPQTLEEVLAMRGVPTTVYREVTPLLQAAGMAPLDQVTQMLQRQQALIPQVARAYQNISYVMSMFEKANNRSAQSMQELIEWASQWSAGRGVARRLYDSILFLQQTGLATFQGLENQIRRLGLAAVQAGSGLNLFIEPLDKLMLKVAQWAAATFGVFAIIGMFRQAISTVIELDLKLRELARVLPVEGTPEQRLQIATQVFRQAAPLAQIYGMRLSEVADAMTELARRGRTTAEILDLIQVSMAASRVAELNLTEATQYLDAAIRSFGLSARDAAAILDMWNKVADASGASTQDLGMATARMGAVMKLTGTDVAQTAAMIATLREATQRSAREIGTALRSIFIQMRRPQAILALRGFAGIETFSAEGGIRPTIDILAQLAAKWDTLSQTQRHNLAVANAQIFRYNEFVVLLEKFSRVLELTNIAYRSQGYTQQEIGLFTQSLQARLAALSAEFQNLAFSLADSTTRGLTLSNVAKLLIEGAANILAGFRAATGASGSFASSLQTLMILLPIVVVGLVRLKSSLDAVAASMGTTLALSNALAVAWRGLATFVRAHPLIAVGTAIALVAGAIGYFVRRSEAAQRSLEELSKQSNITAKALDVASATVTYVETRYKALEQQGKLTGQAQSELARTLEAARQSALHQANTMLQIAQSAGVAKPQIAALRDELAKMKVSADNLTESIAKVGTAIRQLSAERVTTAELLQRISGRIIQPFPVLPPPAEPGPPRPTQAYLAEGLRYAAALEKHRQTIAKIADERLKAASEFLRLLKREEGIDQTLVAAVEGNIKRLRDLRQRLYHMHDWNEFYREWNKITKDLAQSIKAAIAGAKEAARLQQAAAEAMQIHTIIPVFSREALVLAIRERFQELRDVLNQIPKIVRGLPSPYTPEEILKKFAESMGEGTLPYRAERPLRQIQMVKVGSAEVARAFVENVIAPLKEIAKMVPGAIGKQWREMLEGLELSARERLIPQQFAAAAYQMQTRLLEEQRREAERRRERIRRERVRQIVRDFVQSLTVDQLEEFARISREAPQQLRPIAQQLAARIGGVSEDLIEAVEIELTREVDSRLSRLGRRIAQVISTTLSPDQVMEVIKLALEEWNRLRPVIKKLMQQVSPPLRRALEDMFAEDLPAVIEAAGGQIPIVAELQVPTVILRRMFQAFERAEDFYKDMVSQLADRVRRATQSVLQERLRSIRTLEDRQRILHAIFLLDTESIKEQMERERENIRQTLQFHPERMKELLDQVNREEQQLLELRRLQHEETLRQELENAQRNAERLQEMIQQLWERLLQRAPWTAPTELEREARRIRQFMLREVLPREDRERAERLLTTFPTLQQMFALNIGVLAGWFETTRDLQQQLENVPSLVALLNRSMQELGDEGLQSVVRSLLALINAGQQFDFILPQMDTFVRQLWALAETHPELRELATELSNLLTIWIERRSLLQQQERDFRTRAADLLQSFLIGVLSPAAVEEIVSRIREGNLPPTMQRDLERIIGVVSGIGVGATLLPALTGRLSVRELEQIRSRAQRLMNAYEQLQEIAVERGFPVTGAEAAQRIQALTTLLETLDVVISVQRFIQRDLRRFIPAEEAEALTRLPQLSPREQIELLERFANTAQSALRRLFEERQRLLEALREPDLPVEQQELMRQQLKDIEASIERLIPQVSEYNQRIEAMRIRFELLRRSIELYGGVVTQLLMPTPSMDYRQRYAIQALERLLQVEMEIARREAELREQLPEGAPLPRYFFDWAEQLRGAELFRLKIEAIRLEYQRWFEIQDAVFRGLNDILMSAIRGADALEQSLTRFVNSLIETWLQRRIEQVPFLREVSEWITAGVTGEPAPVVGLVQTGVAAVDMATQRAITNLQLLQSQLALTGSTALEAWSNIAGFINTAGGLSAPLPLTLNVPASVSESILQRTQKDWADIVSGQKALPVAVVGVGGAASLPQGSTPVPQAGQRRPNWAQRALNELLRFGTAWSLFQTMREADDPLTGAIAGGMLTSLFTSNPLLIGAGALLGAFGLFRRRRRPPTPPPALYQPPQQFYSSPLFMLPASAYFSGRAPSALAPVTINITQNFNAPVGADVAMEFRSGATTIARQLALEIRRGLR